MAEAPASPLYALHVREVRVAKGLFLREVAPQIGVSVSFLAHAELGQRHFKLKHIAALVRVLQTPSSHLVTYSDDPPRCECPDGAAKGGL